MVHISQVESGLKSGCVCPCCRSLLVARKGIKVAHHFAHHDNTNCHPETVLHFVAKTFLLEKIKKHLTDRTPLTIAWPCEKCKKIHEANLLRRSTQVHLERDLGICRPDILLQTEKGTSVAAIEVIVTHKPEESTRLYYQQQGISLIEFDILGGKDLEMLQRGEALMATRIDQCISPKCKLCQTPLKENHLVIDLAVCRRCKRHLKVCFIQIAENYTRGTYAFDNYQTQVAKNCGVCLEQQFSQTLGKKYLANTCPTCQTFVGEHYLHRTNKDISHREKYLIGYHCIDCSRDWPCKPIKIATSN